ncbi:hypothetical protein [Vibrio vulnificus]|uniref:hypothetical protein n=1 Tax=Vibrio vulnificus TaxID=672 RepID=UPI0024DF3F94|nr:hypothetical protein [Vibrio vulnificus]MDK2627013.1 hypothetical protein [Vibrio vulnificus]
MERCPAIVGVVFDDESLKAIDRINELHELEKSAKFFISIGNLFNIFAGNTVKGAGSSGLTKAISAVPFVKNSDGFTPEFNCEVRHSPISSSQCHLFKDNRWLLEA